jgi:hypothetical protein
VAHLEAHSTIFRERGLSSDTSLLVDHALDRTLSVLAAARVLPRLGVRCVAIIGPGLDVINKADGHDFYPLQSIQPFAVLDSLLRLELAAPSIEVLALDVSPRVTSHLDAARSDAARGVSYQLTMPLSDDERWTSDLRQYWEALGGRIGSAAAVPRTPSVTRARVRAVAVQPRWVERVRPVVIDVVSERLSMGTERCDLVIATNVFVYYDIVEQALASANLAAMVRPGGVLLSNNDLHVSSPWSPTVGHLGVTYSDRQGDNVFVYQRQ